MLTLVSRRPSVVARYMSSLAFASVDPSALSASSPHTIQNLVAGEWTPTEAYQDIPDPIHGGTFIKAPLTSADELKPFVNSSKACPKHGLHNPLKSPDRYVMLGDVSFKAAAALRDPQVFEFFWRLVQLTSPKSDAQAQKEVEVTRLFLENFAGDGPRFCARGFEVAGDHQGQRSSGYRWPYGPVALITPFNFPIEIPVLQLMGALYMGNKPTLKVDSKVSIVMEQFLRLLHDCGLPNTDVDFINSDGLVMQRFLRAAKPRTTQFTGSSGVANLLAKELRGKVSLEDAGFDWKVLGPDVGDVDYVAYTADQDAYACSGQKCSAQSMLFMHTKWKKKGLLEKMEELAKGRKLSDLTIGPVLTWTTEQMLAHVDELLAIKDAKLLWGGKPLTGHTIPSCYGAIEPTAVFIPLHRLLTARNFKLATKEVFGPVQVITSYTNRQLPRVQLALERMDAHLTAAVVSNDTLFCDNLLANSVNGTTYVGRRARTTGAPQNHWFGPAGDPRAAGIGTVEAIRQVWSCHREIIRDVGPIPADWEMPATT